MSGPLRVIIADDEQMARTRLQRLAAEHGDVEVVAVCADAGELLAALPGARADLVLLDISMPGRSGLDVRRQLGEAAPPIVLVTAHPEHAPEAFDLGVVDYVLKPVTAERLAKALARARAAAHKPPRLTLQTRRGLEVFAVDGLVAARSDGPLVTLITTRGEWPTALTLKALAARLPAAQFARVDRRHLVNLDAIVRVETHANGAATAVLELGPSGAAGGAERSGTLGPSGAAGGAERSGTISPSGAAGGAERSDRITLAVPVSRQGARLLRRRLDQ